MPLLPQLARQGLRVQKSANEYDGDAAWDLARVDVAISRCVFRKSNPVISISFCQRTDMT
jgi:hypothetical protein